MSDEPVGIPEDELHAFADGQLSAERRAAVEAWLKRNPDRAREVDSWIAQNAAIRTAFPAEGAQGGDRLMTRRPPARRMGPAAIAASIALVFCLGGVAGYGIARQADNRSDEVAIDDIARVSRANYIVYSGEVRHPVEVRADERDHLVAWLGKKLGGEMHAPDLATEGFQLVGGRLVTVGDAPGAMLMYQDDSGARLTMLTARDSRNGQTGFRFSRAGDVDTFYWVDGPFGFALSGAVGRDRLEKVANAVYAQIAG